MIVLFVMVLAIDYKSVIDNLRLKFSPDPLREAGLEKPIFYAFQARAEWEMLGLADELGEKLKEEYGLHPAGQDGIGLNWRKLNERIWVPAQYLEWSDNPRTGCSIFSHDEINCVIGGLSYTTSEDEDLAMKVIYGPDERGSSQAKIDALLRDRKWREPARTYSLRLLEHTLKYEKYVKEEFHPVLEALVSAYRSEMRQ